MTSVSGIHHVTAIAGDPQRNFDFYTGVLGLRFVKRTVNFDDPRTYHFYFGDEHGAPGSIMTFFPWPGAHKGRQGTGQVAIVSFAIAPRALGFWLEHLLRHGIRYEGPARRRYGSVSEQVLSFSDPDGMLLELVAHAGAEVRGAWGGAKGISRADAIHGFHSVTIWADKGEATERVLTDTLGFHLLDESDGTRCFGVDDDGPGKLVKVRSVGGFPRGVEGTGTVHHVAWRASDDNAQIALRDAVIASNLRPTSVIDRKYFHSVYFREPGGVLFELATDTPGFSVDEPPDQLGNNLQLPARFEPQRAAIEAALPRVDFSERAAGSAFVTDAESPNERSVDSLGFVHRYIPPRSETGEVLLLLHGTGGDEDDLIPLAELLMSGAGILSPRGKVDEGGALRFFRRIAEGVFDMTDLAHRTTELAEFVEKASTSYGIDRGRIVAVGFSNGANIATSLLLRHPGLLRAAVLLSPMLPYEPESLPDLSGTRVFIGAGESDPLVPRQQAERLRDALMRAGADVVMHWYPGGHGITPSEVDAARAWIGTSRD